MVIRRKGGRKQAPLPVIKDTNICHYCGKTFKGEGLRNDNVGLPGMRVIVCDGDCEALPANAHLVPHRTW